MSLIPYTRHHVRPEDIAAVVEVLNSDYLTQGPKNEAFEKAFADYVQAPYAVTVSSGSTALHLSVLALGLQPGQKVITTPITFSASANCVRYCGGEVMFVDIDPETRLLDPIKLRHLLEHSPKNEYAGIIPVDFSGRVENSEEIREIANEHGLWIIEDACHAPGAFFTDSQGQKQLAGNGRFADLTVFSFHPAKHIACGEGGIVTTRNAALSQKIKLLRSHGITRETGLFENPPETAMGLVSPDDSIEGFPGWYMEMQELGYNYRMTDIHAALGLSQLTAANDGLKRRLEIAARYTEAFQGQDWLIRSGGRFEGHAYHLYVIEVEKRFELYNHLRLNGVAPQVHYAPVHTMPYYRKQGWSPADLPLSLDYYKHCLSLPQFPTLSTSDQEHIIQKIKEFYDQ